MKYHVLIPEVHIGTVEVEADSFEDAINKASDRYDNENIECFISGVPEFSHVMQKDSWDALKVAD